LRNTNQPSGYGQSPIVKSYLLVMHTQFCTDYISWLKTLCESE
jgi:hypothetical protein